MSSGFFNSNAFFWLVAGAFVGGAMALSFGHVWRRVFEKYGRLRGALFAAGATCVLFAVAIPLYLFVGRPDLATAPTGVHAVSASNRQPNSMEEATATLAARLAHDGGSDSDWDLLAQSYDFLGRGDDAKRARQHMVDAAAEPAEQVSPVLVEAQSLRQARKFEQARAAYERAIDERSMTADAWADYADVLASLTDKKLSGAPARAIDNALALNPNHAKALWLKASLAHEEHRYSDAIVLWKKLRSLMANDSSDARIVDDNIAEAEQLTTGDSNARPTAVEVNGTIEIDPKLATLAAPGSTLYIYAKSVDSPGPPLAVFRTAVATWPVKFKLDDSMAMIPGRNLSSANKIIIEARVSRTGQATATTGDLQAVGASVNPRDHKSIRLRIDRQVG